MEPARPRRGRRKEKDHEEEVVADGRQAAAQAGEANESGGPAAAEGGPASQEGARRAATGKRSSAWLRTSMHRWKNSRSTWNDLSGQGTGQFHLIREREVCALQARPSLVSTEQLPEEKILHLARAGRPATD